MTEQIKKIREFMSKDEALIQLAEEANELAIESFKINNKAKYAEYIDRFITNDFLEEIADVKLCIDIVGDYNCTNTRNYKLFKKLVKYCCELSKAAIKLRRTLVNTSPTPVSKEEAEEKFIEAIINVKSCINAMGDYWDCKTVNDIYFEKANRCINRMIENNISKG